MHIQITLTALGEMFEAARSIMNWLGECAKVCHLFASDFNFFFILMMYYSSIAEKLIL